MTRALAVLGAMVMVGVLAVTARVAAHHSLTVEFDITRTITVTGTVTEMRWTNPHSWLHVDVKGPGGQVEKWQIEFASPNSLYRRGWRRGDLPANITVTVVGYPSRDTKNKVMSATDVKLPDGRTLFAGTPPPGTP